MKFPRNYTQRPTIFSSGHLVLYADQLLVHTHPPLCHALMQKEVGKEEGGETKHFKEKEKKIQGYNGNVDQVSKLIMRTLSLIKPPVWKSPAFAERTLSCHHQHLHIIHQNNKLKSEPFTVFYTAKLDHWYFDYTRKPKCSLRSNKQHIPWK